MRLLALAEKGKPVAARAPAGGERVPSSSSAAARDDGAVRGARAGAWRAGGGSVVGGSGLRGGEVRG